MNSYRSTVSVCYNFTSMIRWQWDGMSWKFSVFRMIAAVGLDVNVVLDQTANRPHTCSLSMTSQSGSLRMEQNEWEKSINTIWLMWMMHLILIRYDIYESNCVDNR